MNDANRWCEGCLRSRGEIAAWGAMADFEKLTVWAQLTQRREALPPLPRVPTPNT